MEAIAQQFLNLAIMERALPLLLMGLRQTAILCLVVIPLGLAGGLGVALLSRSPLRLVRWAAVVGIDFFRAIPPLVLLIFIYSGLPFAGIRPSPLTAVAIAFFLNTSSYYGEIYRAGIESVGQGQWDAARSTGLRAHQALAYVVLPQAVRNVLPDLVSNAVEVVKLTSIASVERYPNFSIPPIWRDRLPSTTRRWCWPLRSTSSSFGRWCGWSAGSNTGSPNDR